MLFIFGVYASPHVGPLSAPPSSSWPEFVWRRGVKEEQTQRRAACLTSDLMVYEKERERKERERNGLNSRLNKPAGAELLLPPLSPPTEGWRCICRCRMKTGRLCKGRQRGGMRVMRSTLMCCRRDHQQPIPAFVSPSSWQRRPLCGQHAVSEGVQLVETGVAKQAVTDKRRWTRYVQQPSTHTALSAVWVLGCTLDTPGFIILDRTLVQQYSLHRGRLLRGTSADCFQAPHDSYISTDKLQCT